MDLTATVIIIRADALPYPEEKFQKTLDSILAQENVSIDKIVVAMVPEKQGSLSSQKESSAERGTNIPVHYFGGNRLDFYATLSDVFSQANGESIVLVNGMNDPVYLKKNAVCALCMSLRRIPRAGMVYADYSVEGGKDVHLLEYHPGRVRDNLDLGHVFAFPTREIQAMEFLKGLQSPSLYHLRLRVSENRTIRHISNRMEGSLYSIERASKQHNVFDYLQSAKSHQQEMERVLTHHLENIGACLAPGHYPKEREKAPVGEIAVSIIVPVYRRPDFIRVAIESALQQTLQKRVEVIVVVNGGKEDPTAQAVQDYLPGGKLHRKDAPEVRLLVVDLNNIGFCLNLGISIARGRYYLQLDSDDRLKPEAAEKVLEAFDKDSRTAMVIGSYEVWEKKADGQIVRKEEIPVVKHEEWTEENGRNNLLRINGAGAPRAYDIQVVKSFGGFSVNDEPYSRNYGEDYEMVMKISEKYRIERIWEPIYEVIRHSGGTDHSIDQHTIDLNDNAKDMMRLEAIQRRKGSV